MFCAVVAIQAFGHVKQVPSTTADEARVKQRSGSHRPGGHGSGVLELLRSGEDDRREERKHFEDVLKRGFETGESAAHAWFNFVLDDELRAQVEAPQACSAEDDGQDEGEGCGAARGVRCRDPENGA